MRKGNADVSFAPDIARRKYAQHCSTRLEHSLNLAEYEREIFYVLHYLIVGDQVEGRISERNAAVRLHRPNPVAKQARRFCFQSGSGATVVHVAAIDVETCRAPTNDGATRSAAVVEHPPAVPQRLLEDEAIRYIKL